jgi:hypothetical protein
MQERHDGTLEELVTVRAADIRNSRVLEFGLVRMKGESESRAAATVSQGEG